MVPAPARVVAASDPRFIKRGACHACFDVWFAKIPIAHPLRSAISSGYFTDIQFEPKKTVGVALRTDGTQKFTPKQRFNRCPAAETYQVDGMPGPDRQPRPHMQGYRLSLILQIVTRATMANTPSFCVPMPLIVALVNEPK
jgi:hypothetical protein